MSQGGVNDQGLDNAASGRAFLAPKTVGSRRVQSSEFHTNINVINSLPAGRDRIGFKSLMRS
jgi:hypothetical protein